MLIEDSAGFIVLIPLAATRKNNRLDGYNFFFSSFSV